MTLITDKVSNDTASLLTDLSPFVFDLLLLLQLDWSSDWIILRVMVNKNDKCLTGDLITELNI
jgi:hypothetical protein